MVLIFTPKAFCEGTATKSVKMLGLTYRQEEESNRVLLFLVAKRNPYHQATLANINNNLKKTMRTNNLQTISFMVGTISIKKKENSENYLFT